MIDQEVRGELKLESVISRTGLPVLKCEGLFFNSKYDPLKDSRKFVSRLNLDNKKVVIFLGGGFYYIPLLIKEQFPFLRVMVVEAEPRIKSLAQEIRKSALSDLEIVVSSDIQNPAYFSNQFGLAIAPTQIEFVEHQPSVNSFGKEYGRIKNLYLENIKRFLANLETTEFFGKRWLNNIISNLKLLQQRVCHRPVILDKKAIVVLVVPGPTLDTVITLLQNNRDKFVLLALAPALRLLEQANLKPDFVFSMDGGLGNGYHTLGLSSQDIPLLFPLYINTNVLRDWQGPLIPFSFGTAIERSLLGSQLPELNETVTVADFALQIIARMSPQKIFLAGQDFAVKGASHHCSEYRFEQDALFSTTRCKTFLKFHDVQWRDKWVKKGDFSSNPKLLMYKAALLETVNKLDIPVFSLTSSPFLTEIPVDNLANISMKAEKSWEFLKYSVDFRANLEVMIAGIEGSLENIDNQAVTSAILKKIISKPGMRAVLELLKPTDLYLYDMGDVSKRGNEFLANLTFELKNISDKFQNSLNT